MAPNRLPETRPAFSSSEEDGSDTEGSDTEDETPTAPSSLFPETKSRPSDSFSSGSDSESDSPDNNSRKPDPTTKPITAASKPTPTEDPSNSTTKKPRSKPAVPASPNLKRPAESDPKDAKRAKKKSPVSEEEENGGKDNDQKKQLFQRLWSEEDEIVILNGIMDYVTEKGTDPVNDLNTFHEFIRKSLHIDVTNTQLSDKLRRLKKKFENNASKEKVGKDRTFSKPHEQKAYDLSKKIWAPDGKLLGVDSSKVNGSVKKKANQRGGKAVVSPKVDGSSGVQEGVRLVEVETAVPLQSVGRRIGRMGRGIGGESSVESEVLNEGFELLSSAKREELEDKWKKLRLEEYEVYLKRVELVREQTKLVVDALKAEGN